MIVDVFDPPEGVGPSTVLPVRVAELRRLYVQGWADACWNDLGRHAEVVAEAPPEGAGPLELHWASAEPKLRAIYEAEGLEGEDGLAED